MAQQRMPGETSTKPETVEAALHPAVIPPVTLGLDIGGSNIKAAAVDAAGRLLGEQVRTPTPKPATPEAVLASIAKLVADAPHFDRISVGFPGVVRGGEDEETHHSVKLPCEAITSGPCRPRPRRRA